MSSGTRLLGILLFYLLARGREVDSKLMRNLFTDALNLHISVTN